EAVAAAALVLLDQPGVGEGRLRVLVQQPHVRVRRRVVGVEVILLDVLAVIALGARHAEETLLEDGVLAVPEGGGEAEELVAVAQAGDAVLAPAVGPAASLVVGEEVPGVAAVAVVLADGPPGPVAHVRAPAAPAEGVVVGRDLFEAEVFLRGG